MATVKENINKPDYELLSKLVQGTEDKLEEWAKKEKQDLKTDVGTFVTGDSFSKYEDKLAELVKQIKEGHRFYLTEKRSWHDALAAWTTDYASQHKAYREKIYALKEQYAKVVDEQRHLKAMKAEKMRAVRRPRSEPTPTPTPTHTPKKSGWWKHVLGYGLLGAGLITAVFAKGGKSQTQSGPNEGDKSNVRMEERMNALEKRLANSSNAGIRVVQNQNTFAAETTQQTGRRVLAESMNPSSTPMPDEVHQGRLKRQSQQLDQARFNTANAREAAATTGYLRQANDNILGMSRDQAYSDAYVTEYELEAARNTRKYKHEVSQITNLTDTLNEVTGAVNSGSELVKGLRHFSDTVKKSRGSRR